MSELKHSSQFQFSSVQYSVFSTRNLGGGSNGIIIRAQKWLYKVVCSTWKLPGSCLEAVEMRYESCMYTLSDDAHHEPPCTPGDIMHTLSHHAHPKSSSRSMKASSMNSLVETTNALPRPCENGLRGVVLVAAISSSDTPSTLSLWARATNSLTLRL